MSQQSLALTAKRLIQKNGRPIRLFRNAPAMDQSKPWRKDVVTGDKYTDEVSTFGAFVVPATSIPTESRGLAYDWVPAELLSKSRHVILVAALGLPDLRNHTVFSDGNGDYQSIQWGQLLQPGTVPILYAFGTTQ